MGSILEGPMRPTRRAVLGTAVTLGFAGCLGGPNDTPGSDGGATGDGTQSPSDSTATGRTPTAADGQATVQVRTHDTLGPLLVGPDRLTLYMFGQDTQGARTSACSGGCADVWPPLTTDGTPTRGEDVTAAVDTFQRAEGSQQVMAGGWPLYYYASDQEPGDVRGQGVNDVWWVLSQNGTPRRGSESGTPDTAQTDSTDPGGY